MKLVKTYSLTHSHVDMLTTLRMRARRLSDKPVSDSLILRALISYAGQLKSKEFLKLIDKELSSNAKR